MECVAFHKEQTKKAIELLTKFGQYLTQLDYEMYMSEFGGCPEAMNDPDNVPKRKRKTVTSDEILEDLAKDLNDINEDEGDTLSYLSIKDFVDEFMKEMTCASHDACEDCELSEECDSCWDEWDEDDEDDVDGETMDIIGKIAGAMGVDEGEIQVFRIVPSKPE